MADIIIQEKDRKLSSDWALTVAHVIMFLSDSADKNILGLEWTLSFQYKNTEYDNKGVVALGVDRSHGKAAPEPQRALFFAHDSFSFADGNQPTEYVFCGDPDGEYGCGNPFDSADDKSCSDTWCRHCCENFVPSYRVRKSA